MPQGSKVAVILGRVSTEDQYRKGFSLPEQMRECRKKAQELGATTILEFHDEKGGDILDRPGLNAAREAVRSGSVQWFICFDPDRFSRSLKLQLLVADEIEKTGCNLVFVQHNYEKTPEGQLFFQLRGAISEFEKAKIIERMSRGKRGKLRAGGIPSGFHAYGYTYVKGEGRVIIQKAEANWIRQMHAWLAVERLSLTAIATRLNDLGVPPPRGPTWYKKNRSLPERGRRWYKNTVRRILLNELYTGHLHANRYDTTGRRRGEKRTERPREEWITVAVPPILTPEQRSEARAIIAEGRHRRERHTRLLSGLLRCGRCGVHCRYRTRRSGRQYIECALRYPSTTDFAPERQAIRCPTPSIRAEQVEPFAWQQVREWLLDRELLLQVLEEQRAAARPADQSALSEVDQAIARAASERDRLTYLFVKGLTDGAEAEAELEGLRSRMERLQARRDQLVRQAGMPHNQPHNQEAAQGAADLTDLLRAVADELEELEPPARRWVVESLVRQVVINGPTAADWRVMPHASSLDQVEGATHHQVPALGAGGAIPLNGLHPQAGHGALQRPEEGL